MYIPSIDAKDIHISNNLPENKGIGYRIRDQQGDLNLKRFVNVLSFSLDLIKLRDVYDKVYRNKRFASEVKGKKYCQRVINVTFKFSVKEFNQTRKHTYIRYGHKLNRSQFHDCVCVENGELLGVVTERQVLHPLPAHMYKKWFTFSDGKYHIKPNVKPLETVGSLREQLYQNGFWCDGIHFIRWKRSAGSSRVGRCLFIDEKLYPRIHKWETCGIAAKYGQEIDLAAFESYIALTSSSIIGTLEIDPKSILVIPDYDSRFFDEVVVVKLNEYNQVVTSQERVEISNSIWDGQSLLDESLFHQFGAADKGMLLLRNRFFKTCGFCTKIQDWFRDNEITEISQLNGFTLAERVEDIRVITTPNSIKFLKFGTLEQWFERIEPLFGVVKYDKPTHHFEGEMVRTHYQLLNTLQLSEQEVQKFLEPSFHYINQISQVPEVLRYQVGHPGETSLERFSPSSNIKHDIVYTMLGINDGFQNTKICRSFISSIVKSQRKSIKLGNVLVRGTYCTLFGNPVEMLNMTIGKFNGDLDNTMQRGSICTRFFDFDKRLLCSRSPHVTMGNILLANNTYYPKIEQYFSLSKEIVCMNSIGENVLERLSGCDFDSDTMLITDNSILIEAAERNYHLFMVPNSFIAAKKQKRYYTPAQQADLDIKTSVNKIGEIINLSQHLNSIIWNRLNDGESFESVREVYYDAAALDVLSCIEIDKAKKEFALDSIYEIAKIKNKYQEYNDGKAVKPLFLGEVAKTKGFYDPTRKAYLEHLTTMDYLVQVLSGFRVSYAFKRSVPFYKLCDASVYDRRYVYKPQVERILKRFTHLHTLISNANKDEAFTSWKERSDYINRLKEECANEIAEIRLSPSTMYHMIKKLDDKQYRGIADEILIGLFGNKDSAFFSIIQKSDTPVQTLQMVKDNSDGIRLFDLYFHTK